MSATRRSQVVSDLSEYGEAKLLDFPSKALLSTAQESVDRDGDPTARDSSHPAKLFDGDATSETLEAAMWQFRLMAIGRSVRRTWSLLLIAVLFATGAVAYWQVEPNHGRATIPLSALVGTGSEMSVSPNSSPEPAPYVLIVIGEEPANVRQGPSLDAPIVRKLDVGAELAVGCQLISDEVVAGDNGARRSMIWNRMGSQEWISDVLVERKTPSLHPSVPSC